MLASSGSQGTYALGFHQDLVKSLRQRGDRDGRLAQRWTGYPEKPIPLFVMKAMNDHEPWWRAIKEKSEEYKAFHATKYAGRYGAGRFSECGVKKAAHPKRSCPRARAVDALDEERARPGRIRSRRRCIHTPLRCIHAPPRCIHAPPRCIHAPPRCIHAPPRCIHAPPRCIHAPPRCIHAPPRCIHAPVEVHSCTADMHSCTSEVHSRTARHAFMHLPGAFTRRLRCIHAPPRCIDAPARCIHPSPRCIHGPWQVH
jgi:hypothetical protein